MSSPAPRQRRPRGSIDPEKILDGAFEVAERDGLDNLSMPALAAHLDVGVTSIYWYFRNKEDLLRQMSTRALTRLHEMVPTSEGRPPEEWRDFLREHFTVERELHDGADLLTEITLMRTSTYSRRTTHMVYRNVERLVAYLVSAGFTPRTAWYLYSTCSIYTRGFIITEHNRRVNQTPPEGLLALDLLESESTPLITALVREDPELIIDGTGLPSFDFGLDVLIEAGERLLERDRAAADPEAVED